jgi:DUF1680 family protein
MPSNERSDASMGVERVARGCVFYESKLAQSDEEIRWIQVDLQKKSKIEGIKLLPKVLAEGYIKSDGFPSRFKIEVSDDPSFEVSITYKDETKTDFRDPRDEVCTFSGKQVNARYVRLTAVQLRQRHLALTKIIVLSDGKDIAEGCPAADSDSGNYRSLALTRPPRPQGEGVVTDNPCNIIPSDRWQPVAYKAQAPKGGIELADGLFKKAMENNITYLMSSFTFDELVRNFYLKAGKPLKPLDQRLDTYWFSYLPGQEAGRFLMGAGNTLRWMENRELRRRMDEIVDVIDECKEPDGYIMAYPKDEIFDSEHGAYTRSWVTRGLIEAGYAGNRKAFPLLRAFYDWFNSSCYLPEMLRRGSEGYQGAILNTLMYFTPVGKPKDIQVFQEYFQGNYWMKQLAERDPKAIWLYPYDWPHCYLLTAIEPCLDMYRATGDKKYLDASLGGWDLFHDNWEHVGGAIAICEDPGLFPPKSYYLRRVPWRHPNGELCGSVFWAFLNQRFHLLFPEEEKYVTEIEKTIYNVLIANQVGTKGFRYFTDLVDHKDPGDNRIPFEQLHCTSTCCEGQGTRMMGALPEFIYSVADDGVYVDLFAPATITFVNRERKMTLKMLTQFPYEQKVQLIVNVEGAMEAKIRIRIPSWAAQRMAVMVNGKEVVSGMPGTYATVDRHWKNGDVVSFTLPIEFRLTKYEGEEQDYHECHALEYGPILMVYVSMEGQREVLRSQSDSQKLIESLKPVAGKPMHFTANGEAGFEYMPYYEVQDEPFTCFR